MATFKSDAQGFILGERLLDSTEEVLRVQNRALPVWREIRNDVRNIARQLGVQGTGAGRRAGPAARSTALFAAEPAGRRGGTARTGGAAPLAAPLARADRAARQVVAVPQRDARGRFIASRRADPVSVAVDDAVRDSRGRFTSGGSNGGAGGGAGGPSDPLNLARNLARVAGKLGSVGAGLSNSTENLDPTINAAKEVKDAVAPLGRGLGGLFGRNAERNKERWYRRILNAITRRNSEKTAVSVRGGDGGGFLGGVVTGLARITSVALPLLTAILMRVFAPVAAVWGAFKLGQWIGEKINSWLVSSGMQEKLFDAVDWIKDTVSSAWGAVTQKAGDAWARVTDTFAEGLKSLTTLPEKIAAIFGNLDDAIRKIPGIGAVYGKAADTAKAAASDVKRGYSETQAGSTAPPATAAQAVGAAAAKVKDWVLGATSKMFESGKAGAAAVSSGKGDAGGASYGTYQLSSKTGTLSRFLASSGYGDQFAGLAPGSAEFNAKWRQLAKSDPNFGASQHDFIKSTHFDPAMAGLKGAGLDLSGRGAAVQDALWSTSVQFGAGSAKRGNGAIGLITKALAGKDLSQMTDAQIVTAIQDYKIANNDRLFASSDAKNRAGTLARAASEKEALLRIAPQSGMGNGAGANMPTLAASDVPRMAEVKEPPTRLNSADDKPTAVTVRLKDDLQQNVPDRALAHIVTGGIGA